MRYMIVVKATQDSEVRQMFELEDFGEGEALDRFRELGMSGVEKLS